MTTIQDLGRAPASPEPQNYWAVERCPSCDCKACNCYCGCMKCGSYATECTCEDGPTYERNKDED